MTEQKTQLEGLVGKTILIKVRDRKNEKTFAGEIIKGKMEREYLCDPSNNSIGKRQKKEIVLKKGNNFYFVLRNSSDRITSFYELYPEQSPRILGIGSY